MYRYNHVFIFYNVLCNFIKISSTNTPVLKLTFIHFSEFHKRNASYSMTSDE